VDQELFKLVEFGSGIIVPYPTFLRNNFLYSLRNIYDENGPTWSTPYIPVPILLRKA
jgi:hypothetical protein